MLMMIVDNILYINKCLVGKPNKSINYAPAAPVIEALGFSNFRSENGILQ